MNDFKIVKKSWFFGICAVLFGKEIVAESNGVKVYMSYWRGMYYVLDIEIEKEVKSENTKNAKT